MREKVAKCFFVLEQTGKKVSAPLRRCLFYTFKKNDIN